MHCHYRWFVVSLLLGALLLAGCRSAPQRHASAEDINAFDSERSLVKRGRAHAHYAAGVVHDLNDESALALQEFYRAAESDPGDETLILEVSRRLTQNKQPEKALEVLLPAIAQPNASGAVYARLGFVYSQLGQNDKAIEANRIAVEKMPGLLAGYQNLFLNYLQSKQPDKALELLGAAAIQPATGAEFLMGVAELYANYALQFPTQREAAHTNALAILNRVEEMELTAPHLRLKLADGYNLLGATDRAAKVYLGLLKDPGDLVLLRDTVRARLAEIYLRASDRTNAAQQLEEVVRDDPANAQAYYFLGSIAYEEKRGAAAIEYFKKAVLFGGQLEPRRYEQAHYDLALAQIAVDDSAGAFATLESARKKFPASFALEYLSGVASSGKKDYAAAVKHFTQAEIMTETADRSRLDYRFYFQAGAAYERTGDRAQAEKYFQKCLTLSPDFAPALNYLGYMWAEKGENLDKARELIERALKLEPDSAAYLDSLGWVFFKLNEPEKALDYILKAIKQNEQPDATLYEHLGDVYTALQQMDKAREAWTKSLAIEKNDAVQKKLDAPKSE